MIACAGSAGAAARDSTVELRQHRRRRLLELPIVVLAWLLLFPLGLVFPRRRDLVLVVGRGRGEFSDNAKYFYISGHAGDAGHRDVRYLTTDTATFTALRRLHAPAARYPSLEAGWLLLRAGTIVADTADWVRMGRYQLAAGARRVQLWHGVPLKMIELEDLSLRLDAMTPVRRLLYRFYLAFFSRHPRYDAVVSTSKAITEAAFRKSFRARHVVECGYPRNDVLDRARRSALGPLVDVNTDGDVTRRVLESRAQGRRIVLYAPTFRTHGRNPVHGAVLDYAALDRFAAGLGTVFVLKLHPLLAGGARITGLRHVMEYDARCDVYPLLSETDLLVSDYSSIYFDWLLLDRPVVFFPYDHEEYLQRERNLVFDYGEMTPGPVVRDQAALEEAMAKMLAGGPDPFAVQRERVRALAFSHREPQAGTRAWTMLAPVLDGAQRAAA